MKALLRCLFDRSFFCLCRLTVLFLLYFQSVKLCIFIAINVGGIIGWSIGEPFGVMTAFIASGLGSILGVYLGWKLARRLLE